MNKEIRAQFPFFVQNPDLVYLDTGATSHIHQRVLDSFRETAIAYASVHRATYPMAVELTNKYEAVRAQVAQFIGVSSSEIVFTSNASEALNMVAYIEAQRLVAGDEVVLFSTNHNSAILPWMRLARERGVVIRWVSAHSSLDEIVELFSESTKVVVVSHVSNVLGVLSPVSEIVSLARDVGARVVLDAVQSVGRMPVDVGQLGVDYAVFSAHKMYGPTGVGVLYAREKLLSNAEPFMVGGGVVDDVNHDEVIFREGPQKFEAGTPNVAGVLAFGEALRVLEEYSLKAVRAHDVELLEYALEKIKGFSFVKLLIDNPDVGIISFQVEGVHSHDVVHVCAQRGVMVRGGNHCAHILLKELGIHDVVRVSFGLYNEKRDVDKLVEALFDVARIFDNIY